jgi:hypothetical protein
MKLKLSDWASIAEVVGALAIVISLVYVGIQVKDSSRAVRSAAANDANVATQSWYLEIGSNQQTSELWLAAMLSEEPLARDEEFQFLMMTHAAFLAFQNSYFLAEEGTIDEELREAITVAVIGVKDLPGMERYWRQRRSYLHRGFAEYVDELMTRDPIDTVDIYRMQESANEGGRR